MAVQQITSTQISGGVGSGSLEKFSATPGNVTSFTVTAVATVRDGVIAFANTTDSNYMACPFSFGDLATGTARNTFAYLYNEGGGNGRYVKISRSSAGTVLTISWHSIADGSLLSTGSGIVSPGSLLSFNNFKHVTTLRTES